MQGRCGVSRSLPVISDEGGEAGAQQPMQKGGAGHWKEQQHDVQTGSPPKGSGHPECVRITHDSP